MAYTLNDAALTTATGDFAANDYFGLDGATNGPRKVLCSRFVLNDKSYADPSWITSLSASKVGLGSVENKSSATIRGEITSGNVTTALGFTPYNSSNPSGYITSSALSPYLTTATAASTYQTALVSGTSIKTINGTSVLGSGDITISASSVTYSAVITALGFTPYNATNPSGYITSASLSSYLPLSGGTLTGPLEISTGSTNNSYNEGLRLTAAGNGWAGVTFASTGLSGGPVNGWFAARNPSFQFMISPSSDGSLGLLLNNAGNALWRNNVILHAGNYTSYSPSLTGSGASGTWGINVTGSSASCSGNAATATTANSANALSGINSNVSAAVQSATVSSILGQDTNASLYRYNAAAVATFLSGSAMNISGSSTSCSGNAATVSSITGNTGLMVNRLTPAAFVDTLTTANFRSTLFGTTTNAEAIATARWNTPPAPLSGLSSYGTMIAWGANDTQGFLALNYNTAGAIIGGGNGNSINWTATLLHSGNYTSYSPSLTGSGASGTWGINVTGNASNITSYTINQSVGTGNGPTFAEVYTNGWFRNTGAQGLYNGTYGHHFYATSSQYYNLAGNDGSVCGLILRTGGHQGSIRGYLYADSSNNVGFLSQDGNWQMRCNNSEVELYDTSYANDFRSYITYDRNDTAYYLDANSTSYLNVTGTNKIRADSNRNFGDSNQGWWTHDPYGYGWGKPHGSFRTLEVSSSGNFSTEPALFRMHQWGSGAAEFWKPQGTTLYLRETPGGGGGWFTRFYLEGYGESNQSWRAPQFFDSNDTAYYLDPNGTSELSTLTQATRTRWDMPCRTFNRQQYNSSSNYWTGTRGWGDTINWNQAWGYGFGGFDIWGYNTQHPQGGGYIHAQGICSGLHHAASDGTAAYGFQLVGGTNASDRLWYRGAWGNSGNSWREIPMLGVNSGNGEWMWAAGWYDVNNSGYYVNPDGTSRMNAVVADNLYAYGTVTAYYSDDRLKTRFSNIADALDKVCSLNGFFYVGNEVAESLGYKKKMEVGLSAQEVQRILPEVVVPAPVDENYLTIQYDRVVPLLVEAIKELRLELNQLKSLVKL